ncbi:hypothetical protein GOBAR_AA15414 [Gossypium barbadense]|uniref:Uncharacterized protein n=1 Tax=Gossypium barbadense TaxID=3634 RepID=A0A2P5XPK3_GOSBA|nr:hypothetical protein GOBAR_AA15414 [Gossypium barbadense]
MAPVFSGHAGQGSRDSGVGESSWCTSVRGGLTFFASSGPYIGPMVAVPVESIYGVVWGGQPHNFSFSNLSATKVMKPFFNSQGDAGQLDGIFGDDVGEHINQVDP